MEKELSATELELVILAAKKKQDRHTVSRAELKMQKAKNKNTRKMAANDRRRARRGWKSPEHTEQIKHHNWTSIVQGSDPVEALTKFLEGLYHFPDDQEVITQKERRHSVNFSGKPDDGLRCSRFGVDEGTRPIVEHIERRR